MRCPRLLASLLLFALGLPLGLGCRQGGVDDAVDGGTGGAADSGIVDAALNYPPPQSDLVPAVGTATTIDIATWNIENFPDTQDTAGVVADLITSMDLDLVAVQEIASVDAFQELLGRLPRHTGFLSDHAYSNGTYQKVGYVYRSDLLRLEGGAQLFNGQGLDFPRPPLQVKVSVLDTSGAVAEDFIAITLHLKAGVESEDRSRRTAAMVTLEDHVRSLVSSGTEDKVLVLGDFNEHFDDDYTRAVFKPFTDAPGDYDVLTDSLSASEASFIPSGRVIDHHIATASLAGDVSGTAIIPELDNQLGNYQSTVSDHLPVIVRLDLP